MIIKDKLKYLHSIRGFAALMVVIGHAKFPFWSGGAEYIKKYPVESWNLWDYIIFGIDMFTSNPSLMVIIFFVLSGFFIAYSFESNNWHLKNFYINRGMRIYIPYLFSILFSILFFWLATKVNIDLFNSDNPREYNQGLVANYEYFNLRTVAWNLIFVANPAYIGYNNPYWSLLIEAMFYIIAPYFVTRPKTFLGISAFLMLIGFLFGNQINNIINFAPLVNFLTVYCLFFAIGYFIFWIIFKYKIQDRIPRINVWYLNFAAIILLLSSIYSAHFINIKIVYLIGAVFTFIIIYRMIVYPIRKNIINSFFISMGKISYSMYLIHVPLFVFMYALLVKFTGQEVFYTRIYWIPVIIALLISYLFYWLIENQSLKLIKKYKTHVTKL